MSIARLAGAACAFVATGCASSPPRPPRPAPAVDRAIAAPAPPLPAPAVDRAIAAPAPAPRPAPAADRAIAAPAPAPRPAPAVDRAIAAPAPPLPSDAPRGALPDGVAPIRMAVALTIDPRAPDFAGTATLELALARPTRVLWLHGVDLELQRATARAGRLTFDLAWLPVAGAELVGLAAARPLPAGPVTVTIEYRGRFGDRVGLFRHTVGGNRFVFSDFEPLDARRAFPCLDEPRFKPTWSIGLIVRDGDLALSNYPEVTARPVAAGWRRVDFAPTRPLASYLVAIAVGPLEVHPAAADRRIRVVTPPGLGDPAPALALAPRLLAAAEALVAEPMPFPKLDLVAVPLMAGAMENPGLVTIGSHLLMPRRDGAQPDLALAGQRLLEGVIAHEIAHLWFGDLVSPRDWSEIWLNEGLATWVSERLLAGVDPTAPTSVIEVADKGTALEIDRRPDAPPMRRPRRDRTTAEAGFDALSYRKGGALLATLEAWLGEPAVIAGLRRFVAAARDRSAGKADLIGAVSPAEPLAGAVGRVLDSFLEQGGMPLVEVELDCRGAPAARLRQRPYRAPPAADARDSIEPTADTRTRPDRPGGGPPRATPTGGGPPRATPTGGGPPRATPTGGGPPRATPTGGGPPRATPTGGGPPRATPTGGGPPRATPTGGGPPRATPTGGGPPRATPTGGGPPRATPTGGGPPRATPTGGGPPRATPTGGGPPRATPTGGGPPRRWSVPVCVAPAGGAPRCGLLDGDEVGRIELGVARCPAWIQPNPGERGYYVWRLPPRLLLALARGGQLGERERMGLRRTVGLLWRAGELDRAAAAAALAAPSVVTDREALELIDLADALRADLPARLRPALDRQIARALEGVARRIPLVPRTGEGGEHLATRVAVHVQRAPVVGERDAVVREASERTQAWLARRLELSRGDPSPRIAAAVGERGLFDRLAAELRAPSPDPLRVLLAADALASFTDRRAAARARALLTDATLPHPAREALRAALGPSARD